MRLVCLRGLVLDVSCSLAVLPVLPCQVSRARRNIQASLEVLRMNDQAGLMYHRTVGINRFVQGLVGLADIRETVLFPRDASRLSP